MQARQLPNEHYMALRAATRRLTKACGGLESAAAVTRTAVPTLSEYQIPHGRFFMPIDVVADLEADADDPIITRILARHANCVLLKLPSAEADPNYFLRLSRIGKEVSEVFERASIALADQHITAPEKSALVGEIDDAIVALSELRQLLYRPRTSR